jgi:hypothetical protein
MSKIKVYLKSEDPSTNKASHSATQTLWELVVSDGSGRGISEGVGQLTTGESWRQVKDRLRPPSQLKLKGRKMPRLKAPVRQFAIDIYYPEKRRESGAHPHEALRRECVAARSRIAQAKAAALRG